jgi:branched-chain amino acid transport system permease protein
MAVFIYGLINSAILALMSIGFIMVYGVSGIPNFAHGALYILTGFLSWIFLNRLGLNFAVCIILSLIITAIIGIFVYRFVFRRIRGMTVSEVITSFAIGLAIMEFLRWLGLRGVIYTLPTFVEGTVEIFQVPVSIHRLVIVGVAIALAFILWFFTHHTRLGLSLRAIAQDERAALMLGINSEIGGALALALGSALAGLAAVLILPLGNITVEGGYHVLTFAIAVCVCGGLGSWLGAIIAAFVIGYAQTITVYFLAPHYHLVVATVVIILVLIVKPSGFMGRQQELEERV